MLLEDDFKLFQLVKRKPINNCIDLSKNMIGKREGVFYFTEKFRIDFENKMSNLARLEDENKKIKDKLDKIGEEFLKCDWKNSNNQQIINQLKQFLK